MCADRQIILILTAARTGTNHLIRLVRQLPGVEARTEIFNSGTAWGLTEKDLPVLSTRFHKAFRDKRDENLISTLRAHPSAVLETLLDNLSPDKTILVTKILSNQLDGKSISAILDGRLRVSVISIRRRVIDCFISETKAKLIGRWIDADTTAVRPSLDIDRFERFLDYHRTWHTSIARVLTQRNIAPKFLDYETDINCSNDTCLIRFAAIADLRVSECALLNRNGIIKQDRNVQLEGKVSNWPEFARSLQQRGLYEQAMSPFQMQP